MRHRPFPWVSALFICAVLTHAQTTPPPAVEGDVLNSTTGAPIANARVKLFAEGADGIYTKTDDRGHFTFPVPSPGQYSIDAQQIGFLRQGQAAVGAPQLNIRGSGLQGSRSCLLPLQSSRAES
jgi:Carboxypeptidase regulatory-like domain